MNQLISMFEEKRVERRNVLLGISLRNLETSSQFMLFRKIFKILLPNFDYSSFGIKPMYAAGDSCRVTSVYCESLSAVLVDKPLFASERRPVLFFEFEKLAESVCPSGVIRAVLNGSSPCIADLFRCVFSFIYFLSAKSNDRFVMKLISYYMYCLSRVYNNVVRPWSACSICLDYSDPPLKRQLSSWVVTAYAQWFCPQQVFCYSPTRELTLLVPVGSSSSSTLVLIDDKEKIINQVLDVSGTFLLFSDNACEILNNVRNVVVKTTAELNKNDTFDRIVDFTGKQHYLNAQHVYLFLKHKHMMPMVYPSIVSNSTPIELELLSRPPLTITYPTCDSPSLIAMLSIMNKLYDPCENRFYCLPELEFNEKLYALARVGDKEEMIFAVEYNSYCKNDKDNMSDSQLIQHLPLSKARKEVLDKLMEAWSCCVVCYDVIDLWTQSPHTCGICKHSVCSDCMRMMPAFPCPYCRGYPNYDDKHVAEEIYYVLGSSTLFISNYELDVVDETTENGAKDGTTENGAKDGTTEISSASTCKNAVKFDQSLSVRHVVEHYDHVVFYISPKTNVVQTVLYIHDLVSTIWQLEPTITFSLMGNSCEARAVANALRRKNSIVYCAFCLND